jgi:hypothetical protein
MATASFGRYSVYPFQFGDPGSSLGATMHRENMAHAAVRRKLTKEPRSDVCCPGCHVITPTFTDPPGRQLLERPFQLRDKTTIADIVFMHTTLDWTIRHGFLGPHPVRKSASLGGNTRNARSFAGGDRPMSRQPYRTPITLRCASGQRLRRTIFCPPPMT